MMTTQNSSLNPFSSSGGSWYDALGSVLGAGKDIATAVITSDATADVAKNNQKTESAKSKTILYVVGGGIVLLIVGIGAFIALKD